MVLIYVACPKLILLPFYLLSFLPHNFSKISSTVFQLYLVNIIFLQFLFLKLVRDTVLFNLLFVCFGNFLLPSPIPKIEQVIILWYISTGEYYTIIK